MQEERPKPPPRGLPWRGCLLGAGGLMAVGLALWVVTTARGRRELECRMAALVRDGAPVTPADIIPPPVDDPAENAAMFFEDAFTLLVDPADDWKLLSNGPGNPTDTHYAENLRKIRECIARNGSAMDEAAKGMDLPRCRFDLQYEQGFSMELPHLPPISQLARLAAGDARLAAMDDDLPRILDRLGLAFHAARALRELHSRFYQTWMEEIAVLAFRDHLPQLRFSDEEAALWAERLRAMAGEWKTSRTAAFQSEMVFGLGLFEAIRKGEDLSGLGMGSLGLGMELSDSPLRFGFLWEPFLLEDETTYLDIMQDMADATTLPYKEAEKKLAEVDLQVQEIPAYCIYSRLLLPALSWQHGNAVQAEARMLLAETALHLQIYRNRHGSYPETLAELGMPDAPQDPFSGKPFHYLRTNEGFRLWSVGKNGADDGGVGGLDTYGNDPDILFEVP